MVHYPEIGEGQNVTLNEGDTVDKVTSGGQVKGVTYGHGTIQADDHAVIYIDIPAKRLRIFKGCVSGRDIGENLLITGPIEEGEESNPLPTTVEVYAEEGEPFFPPPTETYFDNSDEE